MKASFSEEQKKIIRAWAHDLDNVFNNFKFVGEELTKENRQDRAASIQSKSMKKLEAVIIEMNELGAREPLVEVSHG